MKAYTSEKLDLSFRARPNPNRQDLDESGIVEIVIGLDS